MAECDGFFDAEGIPFESAFEDAAVRAVKVADFHDPEYKKWLILCWFDTTYGQWNGSRFDLNDSRVQMAKYLAGTSYTTYEALLSDTADKQDSKTENPPESL